MNNGAIKFFNVTKGFGFIISEHDGSELFFHVTHCIDEVKKGDQVTYEITDGKKGPAASEIRLR